MSFKEYRKWDLMLLSFLAAAAEGLSIGGYWFFKEQFYVSISCLVALIAIVRWGYRGVIVYILPIIIRILFAFPDLLADRMIIYSLELLLFMLIPLFFKIKGASRKNINQNYLSLFGYVLYSYILICLGRGIGLVIINQEIIDGLIDGFSQSLFEIVIVSIAMFLLTNSSKSLIQDVHYYFELKEGGNQ